MSSFKFKDIKKNKLKGTFFTLDTKHKEMINKIDTEVNELEIYKKNLEFHKKKIEEFNKKTKLNQDEIHEKSNSTFLTILSGDKL